MWIRRSSQHGEFAIAVVYLPVGTDTHSVASWLLELDGLAADIDMIRTVMKLRSIIVGDFNFQPLALDGGAAVNRKKSLAFSLQLPLQFPLFRATKNAL